MPVKRNFVPYPIKVSDGGALRPDLPVGEIGPANYDEAVNFRRYPGEERKIEGWDYPAPMDGWIGDGLADFNAGLPAEAVRMVRRPNGKAAIVGAGAGFIKYFNYDTNAWVTIGSGYGKGGDVNFRRWQIEDIAGYAVFNNGRDCPCTWQVGDAAVLPIYEFREAGYASAGDMVEYNEGVVMFADMLEINDASMSAVMNDPLPYKTILDGATTTRIGFRRQWGNTGNPRDFAATVPGSITIGTPNLVLSWPMASLVVGNEILITGAGAAGGNLTTTILVKAGVNVTVADNAVGTVSGVDVFLATALSSLPGHDDIEDDGSAIVRQMTLKNQLLSYKASGHIYQSYFSGDLDEPFPWERVSKTPRSLRFPFGIVNISDKYHLFAGDRAFYRFELGSTEAGPAPLFFGADQELFFSRIAGLGRYDVWTSDNACTGEAYFAYRWNVYEESYYGSNRAIAVNYNDGCESLKEVDGFNFTCAATVHKPLAGLTIDEVEMWFLMGDGEGKFTLHGRTNVDVLTLDRYGEPFEAVLSGGLFAFGVEDSAKYLRRFTLLPSDPSWSASVALSIYGARATNSTPALLVTKTLTNPTFPGVANLYYRKPYFKYRLTTSASTPLAISGHIWRAGATETDDIDRLN